MTTTAGELSDGLVGICAEWPPAVGNDVMSGREFGEKQVDLVELIRGEGDRIREMTGGELGFGSDVKEDNLLDIETLEELV